MIDSVDVLGVDNKYIRVVNKDSSGFTSVDVYDKEDLVKMILAMYPTTYSKHPYVGVVVAGIMYDLQAHED